MMQPLSFELQVTTQIPESLDFATPEHTVLVFKC